VSALEITTYVVLLVDTLGVVFLIWREVIRTANVTNNHVPHTTNDTHEFVHSLVKSLTAEVRSKEPSPQTTRGIATRQSIDAVNIVARNDLQQAQNLCSLVDAWRMESVRRTKTLIHLESALDVTKSSEWYLELKNLLS